MAWSRFTEAMRQLTDRNELAGSALVDTASGLVWHACGKRPLEAAVWEAAVDYWRLHDRQRAAFGDLGDLGAVVLYHRKGALAVLPCCAEPRLHMVCLAEHGRMDWMAWQGAVRRLGGLLVDAGIVAPRPAEAGV